MKQKTLLIISDCNKHDSVSVFVFLKIFNEFLSRFRPIIKNCIYFSDGAPQQLKNSKNFSKIYCIIINKTLIVLKYGIFKPQLMARALATEQAGHWKEMQGKPVSKGLLMIKLQHHWSFSNRPNAILRNQMSLLLTRTSNLTMKQLFFWNSVLTIVKQYQVHRKSTVSNR